MDPLQIINAIVVLIGIPTLALWLIGLGRKLETLDTLKTDMQENVKPELKEIRERFFTLEGKFNSVFASGSPVRLLPRGMDLLVKSGLKQYIDTHRDALIGACANEDGFTNPYDIQEAAFDYFDDVELGDFEDTLKTAAYEHGISTELLRRIGAIYFRDILLKEYDFRPEDLDKRDGED